MSRKASRVVALPEPRAADSAVARTEDFPWRLVIENTIVGVAYMRKRRFLWANARMTEIFGYARGELDGKLVRRLYVTKQDYDEVGRMIASDFSGHDYYTHERAMVKKDGALIWCRVSGRLIEPDHAASVWVVQDLTDKKLAEDQIRRINQRLEQTVARRTLNLSRSNAALREEIERRRRVQAASTESREKYRALFRHVPLGLLVTDADGAIVEVNRTLQHYLGAGTRVALTALVNDAARVRLPDGQATSLSALVREHHGRQTRAEKFEFGWLGDHGRRREIFVVAAPLARGLGTAFAFTDVTEQHRARERELAQQAALAHAARLSSMGQMTSALAHELGQPLNAAQSYIAGVVKRLGSDAPPELGQALAKATDHLEQAGEIIRNVRGFVSRHHQKAPQAIDLPVLVAQTLALLDHPLRSGGTRAALQVQGVIAPVRGHAVEIQQVLVNLVVNAIEAMQSVPVDERRLEIRLADEGRAMVSVTVADNGPGVPAELAARIFDPYLTTKPEGLGMGLMICRTIAESHGGSLRLLPTRRGATFRFTLSRAL
ncbi:MAG: Two-component oxygen-sensor histidine kinase FixL [Burkholderiaceae bacterium]|jgi:PAS domain S-box-containing protein|nr:MAG: Two-component oxygen-sensor histidine kinase FixL [Burkholderiaceae bacterium]